jgi:hypothetical protein
VVVPAPVLPRLGGRSAHREPRTPYLPALCWVLTVTLAPREPLCWLSWAPLDTGASAPTQKGKGQWGLGALLAASPLGTWGSSACALFTFAQDASLG